MMNSKRVLFLVSVLVIVIVGSQFANAGWFGNLFNKNPRLSPVPVTVDILPNTPSFPVAFLQMPIGQGYPTSPYYPSAGLMTGQWVTLSVFEDPDGAGDIPGDASNPIVIGSSTTTPGANLVGGITSPLNSVIGPSMFLPYTTCSKLSCAQFLPALCTNPSNQAWIICYGNNLPYYAPPSTSSNAVDRWSMSLQIKDPSGWSIPAQSGDIGPLGPTIPFDYVTIGAITAPSISGSLSWTALSSTTSNSLSSQQIITANLGNQAPTSSILTASDLMGVAPNTQSTLSATAFSVGVAGTSVCDTIAGGGTALTASPVNLPLNTLYGYSGTGNDQKRLEFCIGRDSNPINTYISGLPSTASSYSGTFDLTII